MNQPLRASPDGARDLRHTRHVPCFWAPRPARPADPVLTTPMPLVGEYRPSPQKWVLVAREVHCEEKALWWERAVAAFPDYAGYQRKTTRENPVVVLEHPADLPGGQPTR